MKIALENNRKWISWQGKILIDEKGRHNAMIGRNYAYKPVVLRRNCSIGEQLEVKIAKVTSHYLTA